MLRIKLAFGVRALKLVLVIGKRQLSEDRILFQQVIDDDTTAEEVRLGEIAQLVHALEQEEKLCRQRMARLILIETRQERVQFRLLE